MAKITIVISSHLCMVPRPQKEAMVLQGLGHDVTILGIWFDDKMAELDLQLAKRMKLTFIPIRDLRSTRFVNRIHRLANRVEKQVANWLYTKFGWVSPSLFGLCARAILKAAKKERAGLTIGHGELGLWVANELRKKGFRVGVDFEDWHSRDLLPSAWRHRPFQQLAQIEKCLLRDSAYCVTTSIILSKNLARFATARRPTVVYNSFPEEAGDSFAEPSSTTLRVLWFSQTIGPGRGLELLFEALEMLSPSLKMSIQLVGHLRPEYRGWFENHVPINWFSKITCSPPVPPWELHDVLCKADVGLALETTEIRSRNLTITNKAFQYLQAGMRVIATPTHGQREAFKHPSLGAILLNETTADDLAEALLECCENPLSSKDRRSIQQAFQTRFGWSLQAEKIAKEVERALQ